MHQRCTTPDVQLPLPFEEWRPVRDWGDLYEVSSLGNARSLDREGVFAGRWGDPVRRRHKGCVLKQWKSRGGYPQVGLHRDGVKLPKDMHRLVAEAFYGPCPEGMEVAHLDGDRTNNRITNLAFKTHLENEADKVQHGTRVCGERQGAAKLTEVQVRSIRSRYAAGVRQAQLAREFGVTQGQVSVIVHRKAWAHVR